MLHGLGPCSRESSRKHRVTLSTLCCKVLEVPPQDVSFDVSLEVQRIKLACSLSTSPEQEVRVGSPGNCSVRSRDAAVDTTPILQLARAVLDAKDECKQRYGTVDLWQLGTCLRSKHGYLVKHRRVNASRRRKAYLRMLRHTYLVCKGLEGMEGKPKDGPSLVGLAGHRCENAWRLSLIIMVHGLQ